ncbi:aminotransferase class I/II-fold pyridoxal phosphate-dependent enzyme [Marnyiella aurantia]|uniref:Aminotransferase class I/II-fold pyridoxal phosphate-dependent enzyme n=1 Tax=Marnyiella aurantia TaxID=2758037 RepID=A0A7D7QZP6_9FLAO|nr:methionine aminotransferase [Marnyiella aurantia]MBA5247287.1 aminotransferase class I/II-fold pyridoxal phosphate-dependent enzyme [Marnyiella aurantia]QMS99051.1 aminotransferase class I/II-fold pyridoxal phosphate-dependent enzyme [Marnyiella aurantia]
MTIERKHSGKDISIFSEMTALAQQYGAVNLSQGFPDFEIDPKLKELLGKATSDNHNQYAPLTGVPLLTENLVTFNARRKKPLDLHSSEIIITPGATYGIYCALATILKPGDDVIVLEPSYDSYVPAIEVNGGKPVFVSLDKDFRPDFEMIKNAVTLQTRAIIINSPHNPSGNIWTEKDWEALWQIVKDTEIIVISDEVYDLLCYDENVFTSVMHHPHLRNRSYAVFSFGKMFHATGWKVGYVLASEELNYAFLRVHQYLSFCVNVPAQYALAGYLEVFDAAANSRMMQNKRDYLISAFSGLPFTITGKAEGGYFQTMEYHNLSDLGDRDFAVWLTKEKKVCTVPVSAFFHNGQNTGKVRFCFAKKEETIDNAAEFLRNLL